MTPPMTTSHDEPDALVPEPRIVDGEFVATHDVPFSVTLDSMIAEVRAGNAPNIGRFCRYCCTPLEHGTSVCPTCDTTTDDHPPRDKISPSLAEIYTAKRKREARYIHGAAWFGLLFGTSISVVMIMVLPGWTKVFAILFLILGSYYIASYLGNVLIQEYAYRNGLKLFAERWQEYDRQRALGKLNDD